MTAPTAAEIAADNARAEAEDRARDEAYDAWSDIPPAAHRVKWLLERDSIYGSVECAGDSTKSCHAYCMEGCETWPCEHPPHFGATCNIKDWLDGSMEEFYAGDPVRPVDGVIKLDWTGDGYEWTYA